MRTSGTHLLLVKAPEKRKYKSSAFTVPSAPITKGFEKVFALVFYFGDRPDQLYSASAFDYSQVVCSAGILTYLLALYPRVNS